MSKPIESLRSGAEYLDPNDYRNANGTKREWVARMNAKTEQLNSEAEDILKATERNEAERIKLAKLYRSLGGSR